MPDETNGKAAGRPTDRPETESASAILEDLECLRNRLENAERERDEYRELIQRTRADFENYQKRIQRDLAEERRYSHAALALELLPVLDNLQRALEAARKEAKADPLVEGVGLVEKQLFNVLRRFQVVPLQAEGRPFDPSFHEAVSQELRQDVAPGTVVRVLERGYQLGERVLRPAKVVVASGGTSG